MQKVLYTRDIDQISTELEKEVLSYIHEGQIETFESFATFDLVAFDWYDVSNSDTAQSQILIYLDADDIFFLCENEAAYQKASSLFAPRDSNERALYEFLLRLIRGDHQCLEKLEERILLTEDAVVSEKKRDFSPEIIAYRRELLRLKRYYEQLATILDELSENENDLIGENGLRYIAIVESRVERLLSTVLNLREYVTQVRDANQAQLEFQQNDLMKVFTFVTSIFLPLTLLVGWYGMNFDMPEFRWSGSYPVFIVVAAVVCTVWVLVMKHKKWF